MSAPVLTSETSSAQLAGSAFGALAGLSAAELPEPRTGLEIWWQAVALGGAGHYAAARAALRRLRISTTDPVLLSLGASTEGSLLRQLGRHARAAHDDGRAAVLVLPRLSARHSVAPDEAQSRTADRSGIGTSADDGSRSYDGAPDLLDAAADALIGLAADALGAGRLTLATRLLDRCAALLEAAGARPETDARMPGRSAPAGPDRSRALIRLYWVRAETALAGGRGDDALADAETALAMAERGPSIRHQVKSRLLVAASTGVTGDIARAVRLADLVDEQCRVSGLLPLRWAGAMLRAGLTAPGAAHDAATADAEACRVLITRRGGRFHDTEW
ncbi:hypothetical protein [Nocardia sp. NPDC019395]|uniref:hypothetical protein n=1 Tax=Nocardia sp. NPDC019395 TaxID=3154686 RepID=UPI0033E53CD7